MKDGSNIILFVIALVLAILGVLDFRVLSALQPTDLFVQTICANYGVDCRVKYDHLTSAPNAYADLNTNTIHVVGGLENMLSKDELMGILMHEVGHIVLMHGKRFGQEVKLFPASACAIRRGFENEADIFAQSILNKYHRPAVYDNAFKNILSGDEYMLESCHHPSPKHRVRLIQVLEGV